MVPGNIPYLFLSYSLLIFFFLVLFCSFVTNENLRYILTSIGDALSAQEADAMIRECDADNDGRVLAHFSFPLRFVLCLSPSLFPYSIFPPLFARIINIYAGECTRCSESVAEVRLNKLYSIRGGMLTLFWSLLTHSSSSSSPCHAVLPSSRPSLPAKMCTCPPIYTLATNKFYIISQISISISNDVVSSM